MRREPRRVANTRRVERTKRLEGLTISPCSLGGRFLETLQNIQNQEQEHPDDIDKVPVKTDALEESMFMGTYVSGHCSDESDNQQEHTDGNVTSVKPGEHEETGSHDAGGIKPETFLVKVPPFISLVTEKERAQQYGYKQQKFPIPSLLD
jgi:hypothetical protein